MTESIGNKPPKRSRKSPPKVKPRPQKQAKNLENKESSANSTDYRGNIKNPKGKVQGKGFDGQNGSNRGKSYNKPYAKRSGKKKGLEPNSKNGVASRRLAARILVNIESSDGWASPAVDSALSGADFDSRDNAFISNLVFSTLRMQGTIDAALSLVLTTPISKLEAPVRACVRLGTWEMLYGKAPDRAIVNSYVEAVSKLVRKKFLVGFVNGVLRSVGRQRDEFAFLQEQNAVTNRHLGLAFGYPEWIVEQAKERFGDEFKAELKAGNQIANTVLRATSSRDELLERLQNDSANATAHEHIPTAIELSFRGRASDLEVVKEGKAVVQDTASQYVGLCAIDGLAENSTVIDLCAAPGGKSLLMAQHGMQVHANDVSNVRITRLKNQARFYSLDIKITTEDGTKLDTMPADLVLLDAPCSGLGVVRRRPELRWRKEEGDIESLNTLQKELFLNAVKLTKEGGRLVYSVCTWTKDETDGLVSQMLEEFKDVLTVDKKRPFEMGTQTEFGTQLTMSKDGTDSMYTAIFTKSKH